MRKLANKFQTPSISRNSIYKNHYCRYVPQQGMFPAPGMNDSVNKYRQVVMEPAQAQPKHE